MFRIAVLTSLVTATCAQWHSQVTPDTRTLDQIYAAAQKESGPLQVFFGGDGRNPCSFIKRTIPGADVCIFPAGSQGDGVRSAWRARFPNVILNLTVDLSKYHDSRIDRAYYEGTHVADVAVLQTLQDFPRWKSENKLSYYKPMNFDDLMANEKDLDGAYLPIQISAMLFPPD